MGSVRIALGLLLVAVTLASMVSTLVTPRGDSPFQLIGRIATRTTRLVVVAFSRLFEDFEVKDTILATMGPLALLAQLVTFLSLFLLGYSLAQWPYVGLWAVAVRQAGSSMFTVGLAHVSAHSNDVLVILAAATGAVAIALQIGYLPAIYQAFNRRESLVTLLEARAGLPAWGPELLARHQLIQTLDALPKLYSSWEQWAAEVSESHTSYPVLLLFRSPAPWYSWVLSLLAVLDACAMQLALMPSAAPSEARMCLRMGFTCLRRIASSLRWSFDPDPLPGAPLQLSFEEFEYAVEVLATTGFPMERTPLEAWPHFQGWRVNYEAIAYRLADRVVAPRGPWSGERRHLSESLQMPVRPPHRSPDGSTKDETGYRRGADLAPTLKKLRAGPGPSRAAARPESAGPPPPEPAPAPSPTLSPDGRSEEPPGPQPGPRGGL
ncbi:MAG: hypothetical protein ABSB54_11435 [Acidimicrobiales bacterium]